MVKSLIAFLVCSVIAVPTLWFTVVSSYDMYKFASEETQAALSGDGSQTEAQSTELAESALRSDSIVFAAWGAALASCIALCSAGARNLGFRILGVVVGLLLGAGAGWASANLGFWFDHTVKFEPSMTYWGQKWGVMYLPVAGAVAISVISAGSWKKAADCIVGAIIGCCLALFTYCVMLGIATPLEGHAAGFPEADENRILFLISSFVLVGGATLLLVARSVEGPSNVNSEENSQPPVEDEKADSTSS